MSTVSSLHFLSPLNNRSMIWFFSACGDGRRPYFILIQRVQRTALTLIDTLVSALHSNPLSRGLGHRTQKTPIRFSSPFGTAHMCEQEQFSGSWLRLENWSRAKGKEREQDEKGRKGVSEEGDRERRAERGKRAGKGNRGTPPLFSVQMLPLLTSVHLAFGQPLQWLSFPLHTSCFEKKSFKGCCSFCIILFKVILT